MASKVERQSAAGGIGQDRRGALGALLNRQATALGRSMRVRVSADGFDVVCRLAQQGLGLGIVAETSANLFAPGMGLVALPVLDSWARRQHRLCAWDPDRLSPAARLVLGALLQGAAEQPSAISNGDGSVTKR